MKRFPKEKNRSPKQWGFSVRPWPGTRLPSGGIYPPYGHIGHWEVTATITEEMGFSAPACNILCDAAQDPDFYDFATVEAHAQTPDSADLCEKNRAGRDAIIDKAIEDYVKWVDDRFQMCRSALEKGNVRLALYWLGYTLHAVEDLAVHQGITNGEHAATADNPDYQADDVALSSVYARRMLDAVRNALGQEGFDSLRNHDGEGKLGFLEKHRKGIHPRGWDIHTVFGQYRASGKRYGTISPKPDPVRWDREFVLARLLETIQTQRLRWMKAVRRAGTGISDNPHRRFEVLKPIAPLKKPAEWTILVYMAGDDRSPGGIEYAISQDLAEIKKAGSTDSVHFIVQTDDASGTASYRYRLRKGTDLESDRIERFNGDLNTGSTKTLVDFVRWAHHRFPAKSTALVLWGHGNGHDDQNVYRAVRGSVSPRTAARMAQRKLGFFSGTRRSLMEQGPTRGYGYDDTAGDFLDNVELRKALLQIREILGRRLHLLGFDACLMAMVEVAYQIRDAADMLVASERTEPGDGWLYSRAFGNLVKAPGMKPADLARDIVGAYRYAYRNDMTLSAIDLKKITTLAGRLRAWTKAADPGDFHRVRRTSLDLSPRPGDGYCDLGSFLDAASGGKHQGSREALRAKKALEEAVIASCGRMSGLTIYAPGNFRPRQAGSTDALYLGLKFVRDMGYGEFLQAVYPRIGRPADRIETLPIPTPASGLDRFNASRILAAVLSGAKETWIDRLRYEVLSPCMDESESLAEKIDETDPPKNEIRYQPRGKSGRSPVEERRILILPGIMGSLLHDRSGKLGAVWVDPWSLVFGHDFDALRLRWDTAVPDGRRKKIPVRPLPLLRRIPDADTAVKIEASGVVPLIYDRMALALMHTFGPIVEYAPFDWRQPIEFLGEGLAKRIEDLSSGHPGIQIALVAHSMGGLVAADALRKVKTTDPVTALVVLGTPFLGSCSSFQALRAERKDLLLLELLGRKSDLEIESTVQTFRGLFDMMPRGQEELLNPALFAPGPLSRLAPDDARFGSPLRLVRDLPEAMREKTRAIVCTSKKTTGTVVMRGDGTADYSGIVPGDGTVPAQSALNGDALLSLSVEVEQGHMTLPLDGKAIGHAIAWIGQQFGMPAAKGPARAWPPAPEIRLPESRDELKRHLEAEDELTLGDFVALISIV